MTRRACRPHGLLLLPAFAAYLFPFLLTGCALFYGSNRSTAPSVAVSASPVIIPAGGASILTVTALNASQITITGSDGSTFTLPGKGGTVNVGPGKTTKYTATATGNSGTTPATANATVMVTTGDIRSLNHVVFLLQENHSFDNYFGMLNPYRKANG